MPASASVDEVEPKPRACIPTLVFGSQVVDGEPPAVQATEEAALGETRLFEPAPAGPSLFEPEAEQATADSGQAAESSAAPAAFGSQPGPPQLPAAQRDLALQRLHERLASFGMRGRLSILGRSLHLESPRGTCSMELEPEQLLALSDTKSLAYEHAGLVLRQLLAQLPPMQAPAPVGLRVPWSSLLILGLCTLSLLGALAFRSSRASSGSSSLRPTSDSPSGPIAPSSPHSRFAKSCEQVRARVLRGGSVTPADMDGWAVELLFLSEQAPNWKQLEPLGLDAQGKSQLHFAEEPPLEVKQDSFTWVASLQHESEGVHEFRLELHGNYVLPYFRRDERRAYFHLATELSRRLGATHGALFARCEHESYAQLGSWFLANSDDQVVTSLLYAMLLSSPQQELREPDWYVGGELKFGRAFAALSRRAAKLTRAELLLALGNQGGQLQALRQTEVTSLGEREARRSVLVFPFEDGARSRRASTSLLRLLPPSVPPQAP